MKTSEYTEIIIEYGLLDLSLVDFNIIWLSIDIFNVIY